MSAERLVYLAGLAALLFAALLRLARQERGAKVLRRDTNISRPGVPAPGPRHDPQWSLGLAVPAAGDATLAEARSQPTAVIDSGWNARSNERRLLAPAAANGPSWPAYCGGRLPAVYPNSSKARTEHMVWLVDRVGACGLVVDAVMRDEVHKVNDPRQKGRVWDCAHLT